jgi:integrase
MSNLTKVGTKKSVGNPSTSKSIIMYIDNVSTMSNSTANEYYFRLKDFMIFIANKYTTLDVDSLLVKIKNGSQDPYNILNYYASYLRNRNVSALTLKQRVVTVKNFFEYYDIDLIPRRFKLKVKLPKVIKKKKEALSKEDIIEILNVCDNIRLRTYAKSPAAL